MSQKQSLTQDQHIAIQTVMGELTRRFPDLSHQELVKGMLAAFAFGSLPPYSNLNTHNVTNVTTAAIGSFVLCHARDPASQERVIVIIKRGDKGAKGEDRFGVPGGYINLDFTEASTYVHVSPWGETPPQGAIRELREEILDATGLPILDIDPARLSVVKTGVDYRAVEKGGLPVQYNGHAVELTPKELALVQNHIAKLQSDPEYKTYVQTRSAGEVADVMLISLSKAAQMPTSQFTHPHESAAIQELRSIFEPKRQRHVVIRQAKTKQL